MGKAADKKRVAEGVAVVGAAVKGAVAGLAAKEGIAGVAAKRAAAKHTASRGPLVVKIGSSTLTDSSGRIDYAYMQNIADQIAQLKSQGWQPVVVTSAAIACGLEALGISKRPSDMPSLQAAASVGQNALSAAYARSFEPHGLVTSLVLLTRRDTAARVAYLHARDTFKRLLDLDVVPIVNENDTVSVEQIKFGDNDTLAALVACLIDAHLVVILSDIEGLYNANPSTCSDAKLLSRVTRIDQSIMAAAGGAGSTVGSGGMITKIKAARVLMAAGIPMVICNGRSEQVVWRAAEDYVQAGSCSEAVLETSVENAPEEACEIQRDASVSWNVGTLFVANEKPHEITPRKLWIALGDSAKGAIVVDDGAKQALERKGSSLLVVGICAIEGWFDAEDIVDVRDSSGYLFARGRVSASSDEISLALGRTREQLANNRLLSSLADKPIIHRDELIVFE